MTVMPPSAAPFDELRTVPAIWVGGIPAAWAGAIEKSSATTDATVTVNADGVRCHARGFIESVAPASHDRQPSDATADERDSPCPPQ